MTQKKNTNKNTVAFRMSEDYLTAIDKLRAPYDLSRGSFIKRLAIMYIVEAQKTAQTMGAE